MLCPAAVRADERFGMDASGERSMGSKKSHVWVCGRWTAKKLLAVKVQTHFWHPVHEPLPTSRADVRRSGGRRGWCAGRLHAPWLREARRIIDKL